MWIAISAWSFSQAIHVRSPNFGLNLEELRAVDLPVYTAPDGARYLFDYGLDTVEQLASAESSSKVLPKVPVPAFHAEPTWKQDIISKAPSADRLVSQFKACKVKLIQHMSGRKGHVSSVALAPDKGILFNHVFKNSGTSVNKAVLDHGGKTYASWAGADRPTLRQMMDDPAWLRTAFVRNPMDRALSSFHEIMKRRLNWVQQKPALRRMNLTSQDQLVEEFVRVIDQLASDPTKPERVLYGAHFLTQANFMVGDDAEKLAIDYIGSADHIEEELRYFLQDPHLKTERLSGPPRYYNYEDSSASQSQFRIKESDIPQRTKEQLCKIYADDYCCFGFEFPAACRLSRASVCG